ncbi:uncharacterized protein LOC129302159 [Prosopis cineraria]|uniref:uncharacterized protein LOC129302159 n=1 Tax=Prosopis cineraria TaxID=364024 RepID=UPI002410047E|nr:uncharacterized protein LOC129302159 [Prosopis cineraria]
MPFKWKPLHEYKVEETKAVERMRRLVLEQYEYDYRGAEYNGFNPKAKEEVDSLNSEEEEEEEEEEDDDDDDDDDYDDHDDDDYYDYDHDYGYYYYDDEEGEEETYLEVGEKLEEVFVEEVEEV